MDHDYRLSAVQKTTISLLCKLINLRDNYLVFSGDFNFNHPDFLALTMRQLLRYIRVCYLMYRPTFACTLICTTVRVS